MNTLGQTIGIVKHSMSITNNAGDKVSLTIKINFTTSSDNDITNWLCSNRCIAGQRPWRGLSLDELKALDGRTFIANNIGKKVLSKEQQKQNLREAFISAGIEQSKAERMARLAMDKPELIGIIDNPGTTSEPEPEPIDDSLDEYLEDDNS